MREDESRRAGGHKGFARAPLGSKTRLRPATAKAAPLALRVVATSVRDARGRVYDLSLQIGRQDVHVLRGGDEPIAVRIVAARGGTAARIDVLATSGATQEEVDGAFEAAARLAGLDDDPRGFSALARRHPVLAALHRRFPGARLATTATVWHAFADAVVRQLVTYQEARDALRRMTFKWGAAVPSLGLRAFPTPEAIARAAPSDLRALGVGIRRALTLQRGARLADRLERLRGIGIDDATRWLVGLRGVGPWTAGKVAIEALGDADGVLLGDAGVPYLITEALTGRAGGDEEMLRVLEPFRPHRARVLNLLRIASLRGGVPGVQRRPLPKVDAHRRRPWEWR